MQNNRVTIEAIKSFDADKLAQWLYKQTRMDDRLYNSLEQLLVSGDQQAAIKAIKSEIAGIKRSRRFLEYGKSFEYARKLDDLLDRIVEIEDARIRLELLEHFIQTDVKVYDRCDDSAGVIQTVYWRAQETWKSGAAILDENSLYSVLMKMRVCDGFGTRDIFGTFIPKGVLERIYDEMYHRVEKSELSQYKAFNDVETMRECAHYLKSPEKYIEAIKLLHKEIPDYKVVDVAKEFLYAGRPKESIKMLESMMKIPQNVKEKYFTLLLEAYDKLGDGKAVTEVYRKWYEMDRNPSVLQKYLSCLDPTQREPVMKKALEDAKKMDPIQAIRFFKTVDAKELAARYIMEHSDHLQTEYLQANELNSLVEWLRERYVEAAILLYRDRIESTLKGSISKYYPWAIRHLESMVKLSEDMNIKKWTIEPNESYIERLVKTHERKIKFQALLKESVLLAPFVSGIR